MTEERRSWLARNISVGDIIAMCAAAIGVIGGYYTLKADIKDAIGKTEVNKARQERHERDAREDLKEVKESLDRVNDKLDRLIERWIVQ